MNLSTFIKQIGDEAAAELFDVKPRTAAAWRRGERAPRRKQAPLIIQRARGEITYADIYAPMPLSAAEECEAGMTQTTSTPAVVASCEKATAA